jgi:hypothetical protein
MSKEPFTIDRLAISNAEHECEIGELGDATPDELGTQIHAYDPSLPLHLGEQLRELMSRPSRSPEPVATIALEALDYVESLRRVLACLPSAEALNAAVREALGREPTAEECDAILAVIDEFSRSVVRALAPRIAVDKPSVGNPFEPPKPPTKAREAIDDTIDKLLSIKSGDAVENGILEKIQDVARELRRVRETDQASLGISFPPPPPPPTKAVEAES